MEEIIYELFTALTLYDVLIRLAFGIIIGFFLGLTGVGGGVLIIPILQIVFHLNPVMAVGTASIISALVKVNASISHILAKNISWREVGYVLLGAIPMTVLVAHTIVSLTNQAEYAVIINNIVQISIVIIIMFAFISMLYKLKKEFLGESAKAAVAPSKLKGISSGAACGAIMASTGVGGGVLILPILNTILGVDIKRSVGSSIVIALVLSGISAIQYSSSGQSDMVTALILVAGSFIGVPLAVTIVRKIRHSTLYIVTTGLIFISLIMTLSIF